MIEFDPREYKCDTPNNTMQLKCIYKLNEPLYSHETSKNETKKIFLSQLDYFLTTNLALTSFSNFSFNSSLSSLSSFLNCIFWDSKKVLEIDGVE